MTTRIHFKSLAARVLLLPMMMMCPVVFAGTQEASTAQTKTVWDGVYTTDQAARGRVSFAANCIRCHGAGIDGDGGRPLIGDPFWKSYQETTVDYLFDYMRKSMPNGAGGSLSTGTYVDIVAFLLAQNGFPQGTNELTAQSTAGVKIMRKTGPSELPAGAMVRIVGCLARGEGQSWVVSKATTPERTRQASPGQDDASRALGGGTFRLMFVLTSLNPYVGHRVSVAGLLIGQGGSDGINVMGVNSVATSCD